MDLLILFRTTDWYSAIVVFVARLTDVSLGTLRTIAIVHGRTMMAFWLGIFESAIWLAVVSKIVQTVYQQPLLGNVYAFGFAAGNLAGIKVEKTISLGHLILRVISRKNTMFIADKLRAKGFCVTSFTGEGKSGSVVELYIVLQKRFEVDSQQVLTLDSEAFYVTEQAGAVSNVCRPIMQPVTGWRSVFKKK